jgi:hypothetical protein
MLIFALNNCKSSDMSIFILKTFQPKMAIHLATIPSMLIPKTCMFLLHPKLFFSYGDCTGNRAILKGKVELIVLQDEDN